MSIDWMALTTEPEPDIAYPRGCNTAKCQRCGRFCKTLTTVWIGYPPEPDHEVGECCKDKK